MNHLTKSDFEILEKVNFPEAPHSTKCKQIIETHWRNTPKEKEMTSNIQIRNIVLYITAVIFLAIYYLNPQSEELAEFSFLFSWVFAITLLLSTAFQLKSFQKIIKGDKEQKKLFLLSRENIKSLKRGSLFQETIFLVFIIAFVLAWPALIHLSGHGTALLLASIVSLITYIVYEQYISMSVETYLEELSSI